MHLYTTEGVVRIIKSYSFECHLYVDDTQLYAGCKPRDVSICPTFDSDWLAAYTTRDVMVGFAELTLKHLVFRIVDVCYTTIALSPVANSSSGRTRRHGSSRPWTDRVVVGLYCNSVFVSLSLPQYSTAIPKGVKNATALQHGVRSGWSSRTRLHCVSAVSLATSPDSYHLKTLYSCLLYSYWQQSDLPGCYRYVTTY